MSENVANILCFYLSFVEQLKLTTIIYGITLKCNYYNAQTTPHVNDIKKY